MGARKDSKTAVVIATTETQIIVAMTDGEKGQKLGNATWQYPPGMGNGARARPVWSPGGTGLRPPDSVSSPARLRDPLP